MKQNDAHVKRLHDWQSKGEHSTQDIPSVHGTFHPDVRRTTPALLGMLVLWFFSVPVAAQVPNGFAQVGPAATLDLPPAVLVSTASHETTTNDQTAPPQEVPFLPTIDQSVYDALKAEAEANNPASRLGVAGPSPTTPANISLAANFEGVNQTQAFGPGAGFVPPDTHGAIGPAQFVEVVNTAFVVYDRGTGAELKRVSLNSLFGYPLPPVGQFLVDPRATYDRALDRWVVTAPAFPESSDVQYFFIGVSVTGDATGAFFVQRINVRAAPFHANDLFDYPNLGVGTDAVLVTANIFSTLPFSFRGADLLVFEKDLLYSGQSLTVVVFQDLIGTLTPPVVLDGNLSSFLLANLPVTPFVAIYKLTGAGVPATTNLSDPFVINVGTYRIPRSARQPVSFATLDTLDTRFVHASTQVGTSLFNVHTIDLQGFPTPRWYELDLATPGVAQEGVFFATETSDDWNASIVVNDTSDAFVTWSSSNAVGAREGNPPYFPQVRASGRLSNDPLGEIPSGLVVFQSTTFLFQFRWGDYSAITLDPLDASCAWGVNEKVNNFFIWGSRLFSDCLH